MVSNIRRKLGVRRTVAEADWEHNILGGEVCSLVEHIYTQEDNLGGNMLANTIAGALVMR